MAKMTRCARTVATMATGVMRFATEGVGIAAKALQGR